MLANKSANPKATAAAFEGLIKFYKRTSQWELADATYQKMIAREPYAAWNYGNYAQFLLCNRDNYEAAINQSKQALNIMNYGVGRQTLAAALYRKWAALLLRGQKDDATKMLREAREIVEQTPYLVVNSICGESDAFTATFQAVAIESQSYQKAQPKKM